MKILITGGAGYFGILLTESLLEKKHEVTVLDNFIYGQEHILHLLHFPNLNVVQQDIRNDLSAHLKDKDAVYHLAAVSGFPACEANPHSAQIINVDATQRLVDCLSRDQLLIYASTTSFYGSTGKECTEETIPSPVSLYGLTKWRAEEIALERENSTALRFATIFGVSPRMRCDLLVNDFALKAITERCIVLFKGSTRRTFLHLKDAIRAYVMVVEQPDAMMNNVYNIGDKSMNFTKLEIAEAICAQTGCEIIDSNIGDLDLRDFRVAFDKISALGFKACITLEEGITELVRLYAFYRPYTNFKTI